MSAYPSRDAFNAQMPPQKENSRDAEKVQSFFGAVGNVFQKRTEVQEFSGTDDDDSGKKSDKKSKKRLSWGEAFADVGKSVGGFFDKVTSVEIKGNKKDKEEAVEMTAEEKLEFEQAQRVAEYAVYLGVNLEMEPQLACYLHMLLEQPLPDGWSAHITDATASCGPGVIFYVTPEGASSWAHPAELYHIEYLANVAKKCPIVGSKLWWYMLKNRRQPEEDDKPLMEPTENVSRPVIHALPPGQQPSQNNPMGVVVRNNFPLVNFSVVENFSEYFGFGHETFSPAFAGAVWICKIAAACPVPRGYKWEASDDSSQPSIYVSEFKNGRRQKVSYSHPLDRFFTALMDQILGRCNRMKISTSDLDICFVDGKQSPNSKNCCFVVHDHSAYKNVKSSKTNNILSTSANSPKKIGPNKVDKISPQKLLGDSDLVPPAPPADFVAPPAPAAPPSPSFQGDVDVEPPAEPSCGEEAEEVEVPPPPKSFSEVKLHSMLNVTNEESLDGSPGRIVEQLPDGDFEENFNENINNSVEKIDGFEAHTERKFKIRPPPLNTKLNPPTETVPANQPKMMNTNTKMPDELAKKFKNPTEMEILEVEELIEQIKSGNSAAEIYGKILKLRDLEPGIKLIKKTELMEFLKTYSCDMDENVRELAQVVRSDWKRAIESAKKELQDFVDESKKNVLQNEVQNQPANSDINFAGNNPSQKDDLNIIQSNNFTHEKRMVPPPPIMAPPAVPAVPSTKQIFNKASGLLAGKPGGLLGSRIPNLPSALPSMSGKNVDTTHNNINSYDDKLTPEQKKFCFEAHPSDPVSLLKVFPAGAKLVSQGMVDQLTHRELLSLAMVLSDLVHLSGQDLVRELKERDEINSTIDHRFDYMRRLLAELPPKERWHMMSRAGDLGLAEMNWG